MTPRELYRSLLPELTRSRIRGYAKAAVAIAGLGLTAVNQFVPDYSDEATAIVQIVIAGATWLGVRGVANR